MEEIEIHIMGQIDKDWSDWLGGLDIRYAGGQTVLTGSVRDQSSLLGVLNRLSGLGIRLISVTCAEKEALEKRKPQPP